MSGTWRRQLEQLRASLPDPEDLESPTDEALDALAAQYIATYPGVPWMQWLMEVVPGPFVGESMIRFAPYHVEFWEWVFALRRDVRPVPFVAIWPRDSGKSTAAEAACLRVGAEGLRSYALYVCGTQTQADDHVSNVASLLETRRVARRYPQLTERRLNQYGQSRGWRVNRLRTAAGFTVDAIGLDRAVRGARLEEQRPGLIVLDDLDDDHDTPRVVDRKLELLTRSILPAGDRHNLAVVLVQNLVHDDSIVARLLDRRTDLLADARISGPHPAVQGLTYERRDGKIVLTGGVPTWEGLTLRMCQAIVRQVTLRAFLAEYQHERGQRAGALWRAAELDQHRVESAPSLRRVVVVIDPQTSAGAAGSETGLVVVGEAAGVDGLAHYYAVADLSDHYTPDQWGQVAIRAWTTYRADAIVGESNQGGEMVADVISSRAPDLRVELVRASRGKYTRAEPVAGLAEQGRVHHVGHLMMLEQQLCIPYDPGSTASTFDRMDALVWGVTYLAWGENATPHYDPVRNTYRPAAAPGTLDPDWRSALQGPVHPAKVAGWRQALRVGEELLQCRAEEWPVLRPLLVTAIDQYSTQRDVRGAALLRALTRLDGQFRTQQEVYYAPK